MNKFVLILFVLFFLGSCAPKMTTQSSSQPQERTLSSGSDIYGAQNRSYSQQKEEKFLFFFKKKKKLDWGDQLVEEYKVRMKENAKEAKKKAKEMKKPQYSDPSYFGHKRKPKKRPPHKMKFCEECGIRH